MDTILAKWMKSLLVAYVASGMGFLHGESPDTAAAKSPSAAVKSVRLLYPPGPSQAVRTLGAVLTRQIQQR